MRLYQDHRNEAHKNCLRMFDRGESLRHFTAKAVLCHLLRRLGHDVVTEAYIQGRGFADVLDLTTHVQYEIEATHMRWKHHQKVEQYMREGWEVIVIPVHKAPTDVEELAVYIDQYVHPD